jgi:pimeloyl-ACP methyl ester carboxylesterase
LLAAKVSPIVAIVPGAKQRKRATFTREVGEIVPTITARDKTPIHYEDRGSGAPVVFSLDWAATPDAFQDQMLFLESNGCRCIAHERRDRARPREAWRANDLDTGADDLATLVRALGLSEAAHVGHGLGAGDLARYIGRHGAARVNKLVLIGLGSLPSATIDPVRQDLKNIEVPTLVISAPGERVAPNSTSLRLFLTLPVDATLKIYKAAPRRSHSSYQDRLNRDLLVFLEDAV